MTFTEAVQALKNGASWAKRANGTDKHSKGHGIAICFDEEDEREILIELAFNTDLPRICGDWRMRVDDILADDWVIEK